MRNRVVRLCLVAILPVMLAFTVGCPPKTPPPPTVVSYIPTFTVSFPTLVAGTSGSFSFNAMAKMSNGTTVPAATTNWNFQIFPAGQGWFTSWGPLNMKTTSFDAQTDTSGNINGVTLVCNNPEHAVRVIATAKMPPAATTFFEFVCK